MRRNQGESYKMGGTIARMVKRNGKQRKKFVSFITPARGSCARSNLPVCYTLICKLYLNRLHGTS